MKVNGYANVEVHRSNGSAARVLKTDRHTHRTEIITSSAKAGGKKGGIFLNKAVPHDTCDMQP